MHIMLTMCLHANQSLSHLLQSTHRSQTLDQRIKMYFSLFLMSIFTFLFLFYGLTVPASGYRTDLLIPFELECSP